MSLPPCVVPLSEVALIDAQAVCEGHDLFDLMQRAGRALADVADRTVPRGPILVVTGSGNNGGDGWVAARLLADQGRTVQVWPVAEPRTSPCRKAAEAAREAAVPVIDGPPPAAPAVIVDAILGAGVNGPPRPPIQEALSTLADFDVPCVAADAPTGIGSEWLLPRTTTVCFQVAKAELLADNRVDEFTTVDIGIPGSCTEQIHRPCMQRFPPLRPSAHKGQHGQLVVIGGGRFPGALELTCRSALLTGCDLVHAWTAEGPPLPPSIVVHRQPGPTLAPADPDTLTALLVRAGALLIGPGLGRGPGAPEAALQAFDLAMDLGVPTVIDADGLTALGREIRDLEPGETPVIVTPHHREAQALLDTEPDESAMHAFARPDRVVLFKGPVDLVSNGLRWQRNHHGNARMTVGGTGDCLAGLTAGLLARGTAPFDAARMAVYWLTTAADRMWDLLGPCWTPEQLIEQLPATLREHLQALKRWPPA